MAEWTNPACRDAPRLPKFDVCITTFEMLTFGAEVFRRVERWGCLIVDEAHRLKNRDSKSLSILREVRTDHKVALTGTPLQNHVREPDSNRKSGLSLVPA